MLYRLQGLTPRALPYEIEELILDGKKQPPEYKCGSGRSSAAEQNQQALHYNVASFEEGRKSTRGRGF